MSDRVLAVITTGPGCGMASDQRKHLRSADPQAGAPVVADTADLPAVVGARPRGSAVLVSSISNLGPTPGSALSVLDAAQAAGVTLAVATPAPVLLGPGEAPTALLRAALAHSAAALERAVTAATPELPEHTGAGRPRALDADAVREIATAGAGTSARQLGEALGVSARTIRNYRARLRDA